MTTEKEYLVRPPLRVNARRSLFRFAQHLHLQADDKKQERDLLQDVRLDQLVGLRYQNVCPVVHLEHMPFSIPHLHEEGRTRGAPRDHQG